MNEILKYFLSTATITAGIVWLGKIIVTELLKRESLKFSKLHDERCMVIKKLFSDFHIIHRLFYNLRANTITEKTETFSEFRDKYIIDFVKQIEETKLYFDSNKILIEKDLADNIQKMFDAIDKGLHHSAMTVIYNIKNTENGKRDYLKQIDLTETVYSETMPLILDKLENEFRKIYGVK